MNGFFLTMIKYVHFSPKGGDLFNGKIIKTFLLRSRTRQEYFIFLLLMNTLHMQSDNTIGGIKIEKGVELSLLTDDKIAYLENPKELLGKAPQRIKEKL